MLRSVAVLATCIVSTSAVAQVPKAPVERERVDTLADSLEWVLAFHDVPDSRTVACHLTTRVQPGARYTRWWDGDGLKSFTVYLMQTTGALERFSAVSRRRAALQPGTLRRRAAP